MTLTGRVARVDYVVATAATVVAEDVVVLVARTDRAAAVLSELDDAQLE